MKILFDHPDPFALAHGGFQTQIEQSKAALTKIGLEVDYLRWWDEKQSGDIIHFFGRPGGSYIDFAHQKGLKVVVAELHTGLGSRSPAARRLQKAVMTFSQKILPPAFTAKLAWNAYEKADAFVALTEWEGSLMSSMFGANPEKIHVVPNGVEEVFFSVPPLNKPKAGRGKYSDFLVCTATITPRKRVLELAQAAVHAQTPVWIMGKPYFDSDPYYLEFLDLQKKNPSWIRYEGGVSDRQRLAEIYAESRGFVLLSSMESLSLSALEASAGGCPLLLSDLPWARSSFHQHARYCPLGNTAAEASVLKSFYEQAPALPPPPLPLRWEEIAQRLATVYRSL